MAIPEMHFTLKTSFNLEHVALLDHKRFSQACRRNSSFAQSGDFILSEIFGDKDSSFKNSILWQSGSLLAGEYVLDMGSVRQLEESDEDDPLGLASEGADDVALSILFSFAPTGEEPQTTKVYHRGLLLDGERASKTQLTLSLLSGKTIFLGSDTKARVLE